MQMMSLRIGFGLPWNCSKTALKRLCCLEDMKCRNQILNARFCHRCLHSEDRLRIPAYELWRNSLYVGKSLANGWRIDNPYYHRIVNVLDSDLLPTVFKSIRFENITQDDLGHTNISDAIKVLPTLQHSSILKWSDLEDSIIKLELIEWRLGRVVFHQTCYNCGVTLSRKHALICSGMDEQLRNLFPEVNVLLCSTVIDCILNHYFLEDFKSPVFKYLYEAIRSIRRSCLAQTIV